MNHKQQLDNIDTKISSTIIQRTDSNNLSLNPEGNEIFAMSNKLNNSLAVPLTPIGCNKINLNQNTSNNTSSGNLFGKYLMKKKMNMNKGHSLSRATSTSNINNHKLEGVTPTDTSSNFLMTSDLVLDNDRSFDNEDVTGDDADLLFTQEYSPLSLFIVDHANFFEIVQTILDKYQGSLILQIDFLKFLKLVFKQYVGFKINYYMNKENTNQKDSSNKKTHSYNNLKQDSTKGDMFPKRTQNFKLVRDYLLCLWEQSPKNTNVENLSVISSVHSSPKKLLNMNNQEKGFIFSQNVNENMKTQGRVGHNSIIIKTLLRDIDLIYKQSITLA